MLGYAKTVLSPGQFFPGCLSNIPLVAMLGLCSSSRVQRRFRAPVPKCGPCI